MGLDVRLPIGLMFTIAGALLAGFGVLGGQPIRDGAAQFNINLWWGLALLIFGGVMLWLSRRGSSSVRTTAHSRDIL